MFFSVRATAQTTSQTKLAAPRITQAVDVAKLVPMQGKVHSLARPEFDRGVVADSQPLNRMMLVLKRSPEQETALRELLDEQQTKNAPNFHAWLTPAQFGQQFGVADADIQKVTDWLSQAGFTGIKVAPGKMFIEFSGTAGLVRNALHAEIHNFMVNGEAHMANVSIPQMPAALAPVVTGVTSLHNFRKKSYLHNVALAQGTKGNLKPSFSANPCTPAGGGLCSGMGPADFAKIYNIPSSSDGTGQNIALVARSNINIQDINDYRTGFGLPANFTAANNIVLESSDPGIVSGDDQEATLDVEVSGGVAPKAKILLVVADGTATASLSDGVDLSAIYIIQNNLAPVMSVSFGAAEIDSFMPFNNLLWEQAAAQGITVMVSTGDNGSASIDGDQGNLEAFNGLAINGLASTPFNVAVGGTDFDDATNASTYWNPTNTGTGLLSAKSYIPEVPWNDSCAATATTGSLATCTGHTPSDIGLDLAGGGGGPSTCGNQDPNTGLCIGPNPKPTWQTGTGVPADNARDIPDVSLFAAIGGNGNFWIQCYAGVAGQSVQNGQGCNLTGPVYSFTPIGGTSASSPAFAAVMALVNQSQLTNNPSGRQGNANYVLYPLANKAGASCNSSLPGTITNTSCIFYDVTKGNNSVECAFATLNCSNQGTSGHGVLVEPTATNTPAWAATAGYDPATGLGSVNVANLTSNWNSIFGAFKSDTTAITAPAPGSVTITHGTSVNFTVKVTQGSGAVVPTGDVSLIAEPPGFPQVSLSGGTLLANGTVTITGVNNLPGDTTSGAGTAYPVIAHYAGDGTFAPSDSAAFNVTVNRENSSVQAAMIQTETTPTVVTSATYGSLYLFRYDVLGSAPNDNQICDTGTFPTAIPCPTGTITVTHDGGTPLNDFLNTATGTSTNVATLNVLGLVEDRILGSNGLTGGAHTIVAAYSGDNSYNSSTSALLAITITPATTLTLVTANGGATANVSTGQNVTLLATVGGCAVPNPPNGCSQSSNGAGPTGSVTFSTCGTAASCTKTVVPVSFNNSGAIADAYATASLTTTFATAGVQTITAAFTTADTNYISCAAAACETAATVTVTSAASKLAFTVQPTNVAVTASITPAVQVSLEDSTGTVVASATNPVTIAIGNNAGPGGVLGGTLTVNAVNGVATFPGLNINKAGTGYTLTAAATGLTSATSSAFNVTNPSGTFAISYGPNPLVLSSATGAAAPLTVTVTPSGGFTGSVMVTATAATLPPGVTCPNSPLTINITNANPVAMPLNCMVTATSTGLTASILREERMYDAKAMPPTETIPPATGGKGWWALSAGTGFAAMFLMFLPGGRKKYRAALGLGLVCLLGITLGCNGVYNGGTKQVATITQMTVTNASDKVNANTAFTFSVTVTGGTPGGMAQLFDGGVAISTAGASATVSGGKATLTGPATLTVGTHAISVHYLGDSTTLASQSGSLNLTVAGPSTIAVTTTPAATPVAAPINITVN